jgi:MraZ protein
MFLGEHSHSLDAKGRIILPARFREQLALAYLTSEVGRCLALWPPEPFEQKAREMQDRARGSDDDRWAARLFFNGAQETRPDPQGRVAIPQHLREFAGLEREVVVSGQFDHVEIWDAATFQREKADRSA